MTGVYRTGTWTKPFIDETTTACNFKENYLMYHWILSVQPSQSSSFKALYNRSNHLLVLLSTLYKALYKQKSLENIIFNGIAQSDVKNCQWDLLKVSALKHFTETPMTSFSRKAPCAKKNNYWKHIFYRNCPKYC